MSEIKYEIVVCCAKWDVPRERFRVQEDGQYTWAGEEE